ncbi:hypothetical protein [Companilactobacillus musae]|uniref:hypothetical protein n=1 Tax=Companilactobacillus musae TaxID=1903258 RepID=UPI000E6488DE|nr:hypothetical protein [Companilactobacillus musae]
MKKKLQKILKLNVLLTASIIICDLFILHHHNTRDNPVAHQVAASHQMKLKFHFKPTGTMLKKIKI